MDPHRPAAQDAFVQQLLAYRSGSALGAIVVAEVGGQVVGYIKGNVSVRPVGAPRAFAWIDQFYIDPAHRKFGVARGLVRAMRLRIFLWGDRVDDHIGMAERQTVYAPEVVKKTTRQGWTPYAVLYRMEL